MTLKIKILLPMRKIRIYNLFAIGLFVHYFLASTVFHCLRVLPTDFLFMIVSP